MNILKKRTILKLAATFMLVGIMAGAFAMHTSAAFAATPCGSSVDGSTTSGTPNCDVAVTVSPNVAVSGLSFTSDASVVGAGATIGGNTFTFGATVTDVRETQEGWQLQALSAGLSTSGHSSIFIPLTVGTTGTTATCAPTAAPPAIAGSTCPDPTITPVTLNGTTPQTFITETPDAHPLSGVATIGATGTYTIPVGTYPGAYTGAITLSLLNVFA